jgi:hypothetical protein
LPECATCPPPSATTSVALDGLNIAEREIIIEPVGRIE